MFPSLKRVWGVCAPSDGRTQVKLARVEAGSATEMSKDMRSAKDRAEARLAEQAATLESTASTGAARPFSVSE